MHFLSYRAASGLGWSQALAVALLALLSTATSAARPNYDHLDIEYAYTDYDDGDLSYDGHGVGVAVSAQAFEHFFVTASYGYGQFDVDNLPGGRLQNIDSHNASLGIGGILRLGSDDGAAAVDLTARLFFVRSDLESQTDSGWGAAVGPRIRIADRFEVEAAVRYFDVADGIWTFGVAGQYEFTPLIAIRAGVEIDEDADQTVYTLGTRIAIGD